MESFFKEKQSRDNVQYFRSGLPKEEVNEIIMKIELKKFQKLIENRIQRKNTLLKADIKRMFPQCYHGAKPLTDEFKPDTNELHQSNKNPL